MRITNTIMERSALASLQKNIQNVSDAQAQVSSGLRVQQMSDDPMAASQALSAASSMRAITQYRRNIQAAQERTSQEDTALGSIGDLLTRAKELGASQGGSTATTQTRQTAKAEVDQLLAQMVSIGNTRSGDGYLFGGFQSQTQPFTTQAPPFTGVAAPTGQAPTQVASGQVINSTHDGQQIFIDTGALQSLYNLSQALGSDDATAIQTSLSSIDTAFNGIQHLVGDVGAWADQQQASTSNLDALELNLQSYKSSLTEADPNQSVTELASRQTTYQAAMLATSRVMSLTLTDYMK